MTVKEPAYKASKLSRFLPEWKTPQKPYDKNDFWIGLKAMRISIDHKELLVSMLQWIGPLPKHIGWQPSPEISRNDTNKKSHETSGNCVGSSWSLPGDDVWLLSRFWSFLVLKSNGQGPRTHHCHQGRLSVDRPLCHHPAAPDTLRILRPAPVLVLFLSAFEFMGLPSGVINYWKL